MTREAYQLAEAKAMLEVPALTTRALSVLRANGCRAIHARAGQSVKGKWSSPMQGDAGAPDIAGQYVRYPVGVQWELKRYGLTGGRSEPSDDQAVWLAAWALNPGVHAACLDTLDWVNGTIERLATQPRLLMRLAADQAAQARELHGDPRAIVAAAREQIHSALGLPAR